MIVERKQDTPKKARIVAAWLEEAIDEAIEETGQVNLPELVAAQLARLQDDHDLFVAYCAAYAYQSMYAMAVQLIAKRRDVRVSHEAQETSAAGDSAPALGAPRERATWLDRLDHSGERYLRLGDMQRADLLRSADEDEAMGLPLLLKAGLKRKLALKLPEGKTVREVFTDDEIGRWARYLKVDWKATMPAPAKSRPVVTTEPVREVAD